MSAELEDLSALSTAISQLYQQVENNKAMINSLASEIYRLHQDRLSPSPVTEPQNHVVELSSIDQDIGDFMQQKKSLLIPGANVEVCISVASVVWNKTVELPRGCNLTIRSSEPGVKIEIVKKSPEKLVAMALSSSLRLQDLIIHNISDDNTPLFDLSGVYGGTGLSSVRFENVTFDTSSVVFNAGLHAWCYLIIHMVDGKATSSLYTKKHQDRESGAVLYVVESVMK